MKCQQCENSARYISTEGLYLCSLCSMGKTAVRLIDLPDFIKQTVLLLDTIRRFEGGRLWVDNLEPWAKALRQYLPYDTFKDRQ